MGAERGLVVGGGGGGGGGGRTAWIPKKRSNGGEPFVNSGRENGRCKTTVCLQREGSRAATPNGGRQNVRGSGGYDTSRTKPVVSKSCRSSGNRPGRDEGIRWKSLRRLQPRRKETWRMRLSCPTRGNKPAGKSWKKQSIIAIVS